MKMKWGALILALLMLAVLATGCGEQDPEKIAATVVAEVNGEQITKGEAQAMYDWLALQTITASAQEGTVVDPSDTSFISYVKSSVLNTMTVMAVFEQKLTELGQDFTEEERAEFRADAQGEYDIAVAMLVEQQSMTEEDSRAAIDSMGYTVDALEYMIYSQALESRLYEYGMADITLTDEEKQAYYDESVAAAKETYEADPAHFIEDTLYDETIFYYPENFRYVKNLVIGFDEEFADQVTAKNTELYYATYQRMLAESTYSAMTEEELTDEVKAQNEADIQSLTETESTLTEELAALRAQAEEATKPKADEIYALATAEDADFDALMDEYNTDSPPAVATEKGYPVASGVAYYVQEFTDAAMAMEKIGDISELFTSVYGYHILQYTADVAPGPVPYEEVQEIVETDALTAKKDESFETTLSSWVEGANIKTYINKF